MPTNSPLDMWHALKRRKLVQWTLGYAAGAFATLQLLEFLAEQFAWNTALLRATTMILAGGLLAVVILAWYHGEHGRQRISAVEAVLLVLVAIGGLVAARAVWQAEAPDAAAADVASIAVLPFQDLSVDRDKEYFSHGITDEITARLSRSPQLKVVARTSAFAFKESQATIDSIARALHVRNVLEGSVRKVGNRVRVKAQLIDAANGYQIWTETYDRELADVFAIQDEISEAIAAALEVRLGRGATAPVTNPIAYDHYLRARYLLRQRRDERTIRAAIVQLDSARASDPRYAPIYVALTTAYLELADWEQPRSLIERTRWAARTAVQLNDADEHAHISLANVIWRYDYDWGSAEREFKRALMLNPTSASPHEQYGIFLVAARRFQEALPHLLKAAQLNKASSTDPATARVSELRAHAMSFYMTQNFRVAADSAAALIAANPVSPSAHWILGLSLSQLGRHDEAVRAMESADSLYGGKYPWRAHLAYVYGRAGRTEQARAILRDRLQRSRSGYVPQDQVAAIYFGLGDVDAAFDALERSVRDRHWWTVQNLGTSFVNDVQDHPRYRSFVKRIKAPVKVD